MTPRPSVIRRSERGATLVHMAIAMVAIMAFSALVIDYGIFWVSRRQAQNSADAGALAGAIALAFDNSTDFSDTGPGKMNAVAAAQQNLVWGIAPSVIAATDVTIAQNLPGCDPTEYCVKVDVYRTVARSNPLPTFFARLVGVNTQDVQASATARIVAGTQTNCLRPWAVAGKWEEHVKWVCNNPNQYPNCSQGHWEANTQPWTPIDTYDRWDRSGNAAILDPSIPAAGFNYDVYRPPTTTDPGTGFALKNPDGTYTNDYGTMLSLKLGGGGNDRISSGWFKALDMSSLCTNPDCPGNSGANMYEFAIKECVGAASGTGSSIPIETGNMTGATGHGTYSHVGQDSLALVERDPNARWNPVTKTIDSSCAGTGQPCADGKIYGESPRIVPVPVFDIDAYLAANPSGSGGSVDVKNVFGFFVLTPEEAEALGADLGNGTTNDTVWGIIVTAPGMIANGSSNLPPTSSFLQTIVLVR